MPIGVMRPIPVMTTRRMATVYPASGSVRLDVVERVLHRLDALGIFLGDLELELLLEGEDELDDGERVGLEIVDEGRLGTELLGGDLELLADDLLDLRF